MLEVINSAPMHTGVALHALAAQIEIRTKERKKKAKRNWFAQYYYKAKVMADPSVWVWLSILSTIIIIKAVVSFRMSRSLKRLTVASTIYSKLNGALAFPRRKKKIIENGW